MKRWNLLYQSNANTPNTPPLDVKSIVAILLQNRGLETKDAIEKFLHPSLSEITLESLGISETNINKALKIVSNVQKANKDIVIYGDYDVDGICATAILWETLYGDYKQTYPYIPDRVDEGYGLSVNGIKNVNKKHPNVGLIITVDNGVSAIEGVKFAKDNNIKVIVTDHHTKSDTSPNADVIIHSTKVCGAGVAYAFSKELKNKKSKKLEDSHLELVALATVADCMPLLEENRAFTKYGLRALSKTDRVGMHALFDESKIDKKMLDVYHIGFLIAPRLNASGRLASGMDSLRLLCTVDPLRAKVLAKKLGSINSDRQNMTSELFDHAKTHHVNGELKKVLVAADASYNQGVIGLIASKLTEAYYRPSIVISIGPDGISKGSARSVSGVNIVEILRSISQSIIQVGGHEMAAGFSLHTDKIDEFKAELIKKCEEMISDDHLTRVVTADLELPFHVVNHDLYSSIQQFSPFGQSNYEPSFIARKVTIKDIRMLGKEGKHLKLLLEQDSHFIEALAFGYGTHFEGKVGDTIDILYTISLDTWNGRSKLVLRIKDIHSN